MIHKFTVQAVAVFVGEYTRLIATPLRTLQWFGALSGLRIRVA